ncbi:MAG: HypC/HybG/HupF family hydrogenase formation chaperone [Actinomycetota bacterium]
MSANPPLQVDHESYEYACTVVDGCLTCGDVAVPVTVVEASEPDAICRDDHDQQGLVGVELVAPVAKGDRLLVHGGVAIARLEANA